MSMSDAIKQASEDVESCGETLSMRERDTRSAESAHTNASAEHAKALAAVEDAKRAYGEAPSQTTLPTMHAAIDTEVEASARLAHAKRALESAKSGHAAARSAHEQAQERLQIAQDVALASPTNVLAETREDVAAIVQHLRALFETTRRVEARFAIAGDAMARLAKKGAPLARNRHGRGVPTLSNHLALGPLLLALGPDYSAMISNGMNASPYGFLRQAYQAGALSLMVVPESLRHSNREQNSAREAERREELEAALRDGIVSLGPGPEPAPPAPRDPSGVKYAFPKSRFTPQEIHQMDRGAYAADKGSTQLLGMRGKKESDK